MILSSNFFPEHCDANFVNSQIFIASLDLQSIFEQLIRFIRIKSKLLSYNKYRQFISSETCVTERACSPFFRIVHYEARHCDLHIAFKSCIKPYRSSVQLAAELGIGLGFLLSAAVSIKTTISRPQNVLLIGVVAWNKLLSDIYRFPKVRMGFLSCQIRGTILLHHSSPFEAFISQSLPVIGSPHNTLPEPMALASLEDIGCRITAVVVFVLFRSHCEDTPRYDTTISEEGILSNWNPIRGYDHCSLSGRTTLVLTIFENWVLPIRGRFTSSCRTCKDSCSSIYCIAFLRHVLFKIALNTPFHRVVSWNIWKFRRVYEGGWISGRIPFTVTVPPLIAVLGYHPL